MPRSNESESRVYYFKKTFCSNYNVIHVFTFNYKNNVGNQRSLAQNLLKPVFVLYVNTDTHMWK